jgi:copper homeostasis protein CutC
MTPDKTEALLAEISGKLDILARLYARGLVSEIKKQKDQISILDEAGFKPKQIAEIIGTTSNTVSVSLSAIRKERSVKEAKEKAEEEPEKQAESEAKLEEKKQE